MHARRWAGIWLSTTTGGRVRARGFERRSRPIPTSCGSLIRAK